MRNKTVNTKEALKKKSILVNAKKMIKEKPFFVVGIIFAIMVLMLFLYLGAMDTDASQTLDGQKALYVKQVFAEDQAILEMDRQNILEAMKSTQVSNLDDDYLASMLDDVEWMILKEKEIFNSKSGTMAFPKELAFMSIMFKVRELNEAFLIEVSEPNYEEKINYAKTVQIPFPKMFTGEVLDQVLNEQEKVIHDETITSLFNEYVSKKRSLIESTDLVERKYVESKKLIILSYGDYLNTDTNSD